MLRWLSMTLMIPLQPQLETRLKQIAARHGVDPAEYARRLIEECLAADEPTKPDTATLELLSNWEAQNATTDPRELSNRQREGEEFMRNLARNRLETEGETARKLWP